MSSHPSSAPFACDRRLSRAAREILQRHVVPFLPPFDPPHDDDDNNNYRFDDQSLAPIRLWRILEHSILSTNTEDNDASASQCLLHPSRDIHRHFELQSRIIPSRSVRYAPRRNLTHWYVCQECGKVFANRFYLDLHQETHHSHILNSTLDATTDASSLSSDTPHNSANVCWATDVCQALGPQKCSQMAIEMEPYYGRGSGGVGPDQVQLQHDWKVQHSVHTQSHAVLPCDDHYWTSVIQPACRNMMETCFEPRVALQVIQQYCDTLTCHHALIDAVQTRTMPSNSKQSVLPHNSHVTWKEHANDVSRLGWMGCVVLLVLLWYYGYYFYYMAVPKQHRLFQNKRKSSSFSFPSIWRKQKVH